METTRQDPDLLLRTIRENCETPGKLKIFFGYAAGVGKTYAMLQAADTKTLAGSYTIGLDGESSYTVINSVTRTVHTAD